MPKADDGSVDADACGGILFGYQSEDDEYRFVTFGGWGYAYALGRFSPELRSWVGIKTVGSLKNLRPERPYLLSVRIQGQRVTSEVDGSEVLAYRLDSAPLGRIGLYAWGTSRIEFRAASVTPHQTSGLLEPTAPVPMADEPASSKHQPNIGSAGKRDTPTHLVIFMHGLGGQPQSTWGQFPRFLFTNSTISSTFDKAFYEFPTSLFRLPFSPRAPKIQVLAAGLRSQIENRYADYEAIVLVVKT